MGIINWQMEPAAIVLPTRPQGPPIKFPKIRLYTNHYKLEMKSRDMQVCQYEVKIEPEIGLDARQLARAVDKSVKEKLTAKIGKYVWWGWMLFATRRVENIREETNVKGTPYTVILKPVRQAPISTLATTQENKAPVLQFINIVIKDCLRLQGYKEIGINAKYYHENKGFNSLEGYPLDVWQGFKTVADIYQGLKPKVLIDVSTRVLRSETVYTLIKGKTRPDAENLLLDKTIIATYGNYRTYHIDQILWNKKPSDLFPDGSETYVAYYKRKYNITIKDPNQPLLLDIRWKKQNQPDGQVAKVKFETHLIPELCYPTGITDEERADFRLMKELANYTKLSPSDRVATGEGFLRQLNPALQEWGLSLNADTLMEGHVLPGVSVKLANNNITPDGGNFMIRDVILEPIRFNKWVVIYTCGGKRDFETADDFYQTTVRAAKSFGINVAEPQWIEATNFTVQEVAKRIREAVVLKPQIILLLVNPKNRGTNKDALYRELKRITYKEAGIPSQFVNTEKLFDKKTGKTSLSVCSKIILQMNAKVGGSLWQIIRPQQLPPHTMLIGTDVFHKIGARKQSCVGFCATLDPNFTKYYSTIRMQNTGEEVMPTVGKLVEAALRAYLAKNKQLPSLIIFYRDGVADNQINSIIKVEIDSIKQGFARVEPTYNPQFAHVVITKKINDRFFELGGGRDGGKYRNPTSGTLVCSEIVSDNFDFFICAQNVTQGTATPTRYNVVYNSTTLSAETFYLLTFQQCFNYYNWTGAIRTPACTQYAHKLGFLIGQTFQDQPHINLENTLFYL
eukprot:TRINITY_DN557_c0_g1_i2.p1 TRINITY_DN557_c0_g1~~TRINITY_DN557_c0_g1_i2.p1  ORF type:complete len:827 (+),score=223.84 TRINITY_DN557_c0_g1_i2:102-2483(+)